MNYLEFQFSIKPYNEEIKDILIAELALNGFDDFLETNNGFNAYIIDDVNIETINNIINRYQDNYTIIFKKEIIKQKNWNQEWENSIKPIIVNDKCLIYTSFHDNLPDIDYKILIDPKMAFGTGHHQTTELIIAQMFDYDFKNQNVLDMGCGTGILSILASKLGASKVLAIDYDILSVESTKENVIKNNTPNIEVEQSNKLNKRNNKFNIIIANINRNILLSMVKEFKENISEGGILFLSGFYYNDLKIIQTEYSNSGFELLCVKEKDTWVAPVFKKITNL